MATVASLATFASVFAADLSHSDKKFFEKAAKGGVDVHASLPAEISDADGGQLAEALAAGNPGFPAITAAAARSMASSSHRRPSSR